MLTKWRFSAFVRSLRVPAQEVLTATMSSAACSAHIGCPDHRPVGVLCVTFSRSRLRMRSPTSREEHRTACEYASGHCARVLNTADVLADLHAAEGAEKAETAEGGAHELGHCDRRERRYW